MFSLFGSATICRSFSCIRWSSQSLQTIFGMNGMRIVLNLQVLEKTIQGISGYIFHYSTDAEYISITTPFIDHQNVQLILTIAQDHGWLGLVLQPTIMSLLSLGVDISVKQKHLRYIWQQKPPQSSQTWPQNCVNFKARVQELQLKEGFLMPRKLQLTL